jgi:8-oxo-dGTP pyrophosphatase MutT (NUDIX family)
MDEKSFGVIPIWRDGANYETLLVQSRKYGHWGWPKGRGEEGENDLVAARREFAEETGITDYFLISDFPLTESWQYSRDNRIWHKTARYFLGFVRNKKVIPQVSEISAYRWVEVTKAGELLSFPGKKHILAKVQEYLLGIKI